MKNEDRATENFCFIALALIWEDAIRPKLGYQIFLGCLLICKQFKKEKEFLTTRNFSDY
jgi:hypothetical protein